jgi:hypothetical protein
MIGRLSTYAQGPGRRSSDARGRARSLKGMRHVTALSLLVLLPLPLRTQERPPKFLDIVQERLKPKSDAAYSKVEEEAARVCARMHCPNAYLALEAVTGPQEVWWLNAYWARADRDAVKQAYQRDTALMAALTKVLAPKKTLAAKPQTVETSYKATLSDSTRWMIGGARFFVITEASAASAASARRRTNASVFEAADHRQFVIAPARTRAEADAIAKRAGPHTTIFAVRPTWSNPAQAWIAADPEFWLAIR